MSDFVEYIDLNLRLMRMANTKAREASAKWNRLNDELEAHMTRHGVTDPILRARAKGDNIALSGALSTWKFWKDESSRYAQTILAEEAAAKMKAAMS